MSVIKRLAGVTVGKCVLASQMYPMGELKKLKWICSQFYTKKEIEQYQNAWKNFVAKCPSYSLLTNRYFVKTKYGSELDTVEITASKNKDCQEYVIYGWGRLDSYETRLNRLAEDALNLNKKIISFNFRGVGFSKGQAISQQDLIDDYYSQVKNLIDKGVSPQKITCYGHSLGAGIAVFAVEKLHREGYPVKFYSDRSFANLIETSANLFFAPYRRIRKKIVSVAVLILASIILFGLSLASALSLFQTIAILIFISLTLWIPPIFHLYDKTVGNFLEKSLTWLMRWTNWEFSAAQSYQKIPEKYKSHTVLHPPKKNVSTLLGKRYIQSLSEDKVIPPLFSLHKGLTQRKQVKTTLKTALKEAIAKSENEKVKNLTSQLMEFSACKFTGSDHSAHPKEILSRYPRAKSQRPLTGLEDFYAFVEPEGNHDCQAPRQYHSFG